MRKYVIGFVALAAVAVCFVGFVIIHRAGLSTALLALELPRGSPLDANVNGLTGKGFRCNGSGRAPGERSGEVSLVCYRAGTPAASSSDAAAQVTLTAIGGTLTNWRIQVCGPNHPLVCSPGASGFGP
jgi:hypothetical protein